MLIIYNSSTSKDKLIVLLGLHHIIKTTYLEQYAHRNEPKRHPTPLARKKEVTSMTFDNDFFHTKLKNISLKTFSRFILCFTKTIQLKAEKLRDFVLFVASNIENLF